MSFRSRARGFIGGSHGGPGASLLAKAARKYLNAYDNLSNWEMEHNGELRAFRLMTAAVDGDVFDVGANAGQWASSVLPFLGRKQLHCFEPVPPTFAKLTAALQQRDEIRLNAFGLGSADCVHTLNYSAETDTISSFYPLVFESADQQTLSCLIRRGDDYVREQAIDAIAFLKIDVEGMEMETLKGLEETLAQGLVAAIQFEHGPAHIHSRHFVKDFIDFLEPFGYRFYNIHPNKLEPFTYSLEAESFAGRNLLAVHDRYRGSVT